MTAVTGIIFRNTSVLLIQRRDVPVWVLPGGGVEPHESPEDAIIREVAEETGFTVRVMRLVGEYTPINRLTRHTFFYECEILSGAPTPSSESRAVAFFPLTALPKLMPPPYPEWIADAQKQAAPVYKPLLGVTYPILFKNLLRHPLLVGRFLLSRLGYPINR